jgi:hypothetical protein
MFIFDRGGVIRMFCGKFYGQNLEDFFSYDDMDTSNHVERHYEWIKYSLLQHKVNRSLRDLIIAIIKSEADVPRVGGPTLLDHFQQVQLLSEFSLACLYFSHN